MAISHRAVVRQPKLPISICLVTELEENRGFTWVSKTPGAHVSGIHTIEQIANRSRATMTLIFAGPLALLFGWLTRSLTQRYLNSKPTG